MKTLLIAIFIFISIFTFAQEKDILQMKVDFESAYVPEDSLFYNWSGSTKLGAHLGLTLQVELILLNTIFIGGNTECSLVTEKDNWCTPYFQNYGAYAGIRIGGFEIGVNHHCYHPVLAGTVNTNIRGGGYTKVYVKFTGTVKIF